MADNRTEKATPKRREEARRKGQIARRPELPAAVSFLAGLMMLRVTGDFILHHAESLFTKTVSLISIAEPLTLPTVHGILIDAGAGLGAMSLPVVAAALVAGVSSNFAQGGLTFTPSALAPRFEKFNPVANLKRVFGSNGPVELLKSILKIAGLSLVCYEIVGQAIKDAPSLVGAPPQQTFAAVSQLFYEVGLRAGIVLVVLAALDYGYGWYKHEKSLRMTKQEVKDQMRQQEGDPLVKGKRRRAARALTQRRIAAEVPRADVVVTNPTHFAVALRYDRTKDAAPIVVAKGADMMAKRIREIARAHNVAVVENPPLARALYRTVEMGRTIPPEFFRIVAELLAYVYRQRERAASL